MPSKSRASQRQAIDAIVKIQTCYAQICEDQSVVFRTNPAEYLKAYDHIMQSPEVAKPGQNWVPSSADRDAYIHEMMERCKVVPKSFDDRVRVFFAAHAIVTCTMYVDMVELPEASQLEIMQKTGTNLQKFSQQPASIKTVLPQSFLPSSPTPPLVRPNSAPPKALVTAADMTSFKRDPLALVSKRFILDEANDDGLMYEVVEFKSSKRKGHLYQVQFEGCSDSVDVEDQEMWLMLSTSRFL